jgi:phospholipase/carboxylesterase
MDNLHEDAASGLIYRIRPALGQPAARLFLLHGVGGNETNLMSFAEFIDPRVELVFVRGPLVLSAGQYAWFHVHFGPHGPVINAEQADESRRRLRDLVVSMAEADGAVKIQAVMCGFSQGGILSASVALSSPNDVSRFAILSGRMLPELEPHLADLEKLAEVSAFVAHGTYDEKLPVTFAEHATAWLTRLGVQHELRLYPTGHTLNAEIVGDFSRWLDQQINLK